VVIDFPDLFGQEHGVRQDTKMPTAEASEFAAGAALPAGASIAIRGLGHAYGDLETIERLDLTVPAHGVLGLVGPSGCGKSTLLELIAGLQEPGRGEVEAGGARDPQGRLEHCAYMPSVICSCPGSRRSTTRRWRCATAASAAARRGERRASSSSALG